MDTRYIDTFNYYDIGALNKLVDKSAKDDKEALLVVAKQLESVFLELVLKSMRDANAAMKSDLYDRSTEEFYHDMLDQQLALSLANSGGVGLAEVIVRQLSHTLEEVNENKDLQNTYQSMVTNNFNHVKPQAENKVELEKLDPIEINNIDDFIKVLKPYAIEAAKVIGVDPKLLLAQTALETGWGKHIIKMEDGQSSYNLFGIKAQQNWQGEEILVETQEYYDDVNPVIEKASFKSYASYMESFDDYLSLLQSKRYQKALSQVDSPRHYLNELQNAGYATDPKYAEKVLTIFESDLLDTHFKAVEI